MSCSDDETNEGDSHEQPAKKAKPDQNNQTSGSNISPQSTQKAAPNRSKSRNSAKKSSSSESSTIQSQSDEFLLRLEAIRQEVKQKKEEKNACDLFGEQVAADLKTFSELDQARIKYEIQGIFLQFKAQALDVLLVQHA